MNGLGSADPNTTAKPPVHSVWKARDGRRVRVTDVVDSDMASGGWWAKLDVLPPYASRQRRQTSANATSFATGFYVKEADFG